MLDEFKGGLGGFLDTQVTKDMLHTYTKSRTTRENDTRAEKGSDVDTNELRKQDEFQEEGTITQW